MGRRTGWAALPLLIAGLPAVGLATIGPPAQAAVPCQKTYTSVVNQDIPAGAADTSVEIDVPDAEIVSDVDIMVDISHPVDQDVSIVAHRDPGQGLRTLADGQGGDGADFDHTVFDDEAATPITAGTAPFAGSYVPLESLDVFNGQPAVGHWFLLVREATPYTGDLFKSWAVILTFASCDLDTDGVEDHVDQCLGLPGATASGCPLTDRSLTLAYHSSVRKFGGRLESTLAGCRSTRPVVVWRVRSGPDARVGTATTRSDGRWSLASARRPGVYYARSARVVVPDQGECATTTSPRLRLR